MLLRMPHAALRSFASRGHNLHHTGPLIACLLSCYRTTIRAWCCCPTALQPCELLSTATVHVLGTTRRHWAGQDSCCLVISCRRSHPHAMHVPSLDLLCADQAQVPERTAVSWSGPRSYTGRAGTAPALVHGRAASHAAQLPAVRGGPAVRRQLVTASLLPLPATPRLVAATIAASPSRPSSPRLLYRPAQ